MTTRRFDITRRDHRGRRDRRGVVLVSERPKKRDEIAFVLLAQADPEVLVVEVHHIAERGGRAVVEVRCARGKSGVSAARQSVARGEEIFDTRPFTITDVPGLTDVTGAINVTCTTCHDTPNVGNHSVSVPLDIGVSRAASRTPDLPLYTLTCTDGRVVTTSDPGRAMVTGRCDDIGKVKRPILRGLAARAPYFHNGSAATLRDGQAAIRPSIAGWARMHGLNTIFVDDRDPFAHGFQLV